MITAVSAEWRDLVDSISLDTIGTVGATGGGVAFVYLLLRQLWKLVTGQIADQRQLLVDAREGREDVVKERNDLREQNRILQKRCEETEAAMREAHQITREELHEEHIKRRQWAEAYSELRRHAIEEGLPTENMPRFGSIKR